MESLSKILRRVASSSVADGEEVTRAPGRLFTGAPVAVIDIGSNSVRLVVFEGLGRNPTAIFNEKAVLRLGQGLQATGQLSPDGVAQALTVMNRYGAIVRAMGANPFEVLATAAVRDATNGPEFVAALRERLPGVPIHVLAGEAEATFSAEGVLCGIPGADGILAGTRAELVHLPCLPTCMVNTTGGGVAVMAALVWAYLQGLDLRLAICITS